MRSEGDVGWYHGFNKDFILSFSGQAGYVQGWNGDTVRISDRFYKGGNTFRGFEIAGIGPRDTQFKDALGGKLYDTGYCGRFTGDLAICSHMGDCSIRSLWGVLETLIERVLDKTMLSDLARTEEGMTAMLGTRTPAALPGVGGCR